MSKVDEYRQNAADCERNASTAGDAAQAEQYLQLAAAWRELADAAAVPHLRVAAPTENQ